MSTHKINLVLFGKGNVGNTLINQIKESAFFIKGSCRVELNLVGIANSKKFWFLNKNEKDFEVSAEIYENYSLSEIVALVKSNYQHNLIAVDATASEAISANYEFLITNGFHIVSANKIANTNSQAAYNRLRTVLHENTKSFRYETNVGAGLPIIETVRALYECGDRIKRIRGVFSGSLSYIFNTFCESEISFSSVVQNALQLGYTEPDPRIDLSGKDVARKLLILTREIGLSYEFEKIKIKSLLVPSLEEKAPLDSFLRKITELDVPFKNAKLAQKPDYVLRYVGELNAETKLLEVKLVSVPLNSALGQLKGTDSIFEIFTSAYGEDPMIVRGAGAGKEVTARGLLSDIIKTAKAMGDLQTVDTY